MTDHFCCILCRYLALAVAAVIVAVPLACKIPQTRYYSIDYPHSADASAAAAAIPASLVVERFRGSEAYTRDRLVYRESLNELNFYEYHRWTSSPVDMATELMLHTLKTRGRFAGVHSIRESEKGDLVLRGWVEHFEEVDQPSVVALVELHLEVFDAKTRDRVWSGHLRADEPIGTRTVPGVVAALDTSLKSVSNQLAEQMETAFAKYKPSKEAGK